MAAVRRAKPFIARADELEAHEPIVAYYCRMQAIEILMNSRQAGDQDPDAQNVLITEFTKAEEAKKALNTDAGVCQDIVEAFAIKVFDNTDSTDRSGMTDASTAAQFYVSSLFLEICGQFYKSELGSQLPPDLAEKSKYAKWRAVQIRECIKKGLPLGPPEPVASEEDPLAAYAASGAATAPEAAAPPAGFQPFAAPSAQPAAPAAAPTIGFQPYTAPAAPAVPAVPAFQPALAPVVAATPGPATGFQGYVAPAAAPASARAPLVQAIHIDEGGGHGAAPAQSKADAQKKAQFAASALDFGDVVSARKFLQEALQSLQKYEN